MFLSSWSLRRLPKAPRLFLQGDGSAGNQSNNSQSSSYANNIVSAGAGVGGGGASGGVYMPRALTVRFSPL